MVILLVQDGIAQTKPMTYDCKKNGFFAIDTQTKKDNFCPWIAEFCSAGFVAKPVNCPVGNSICDFVRCTFIPQYGVFSTVFYKCAEEVLPTDDLYQFDEVKQACFMVCDEYLFTHS